MTYFKLKLSKNIVLKLLMLSVFFSLPRISFSQSTSSVNQPVFNHAALCAKNLKKTAAFYITVLQLKTLPNPFSDTTHVWLKIGPGIALHIIQGNCPTPVHDISLHLSFSVPSLPGFIQHLDQLNVKYSNWGGEPKKIQKRADNVLQVYFQDPDGYWIEVNDAK